MSDDTQDVSGVKLIARRVDDLTGGDLRNFAEEPRSKIKRGGVRTRRRPCPWVR